VGEPDRAGLVELFEDGDLLVQSVGQRGRIPRLAVQPGPLPLVARGGGFGMPQGGSAAMVGDSLSGTGQLRLNASSSSCALCSRSTAYSP
jgi:hypothetical protein